MNERFSDRLKYQFIPDALERLGETDLAILVASKFAVEVNIKPEGIHAYANLVRAIRRHERINLSDFGGVLNGYDLRVQELISNPDIYKNGGLWVSNYPKDGGPMGSFWPSMLSSMMVKEETGKEICWVQSYGDQYHGYNAFIGAIHRLVQSSVGGIMVGDPKETKIRAMIKVFDRLHDKEVIGIYPEGEPSTVLKKADPKSGHLIKMASKRGVPTIAASLYQEGNKLFLKFKIIKPDEILQLNEIYKDISDPNQKVVDFVMLNIASQLPEDLRGYYLH